MNEVKMSEFQRKRVAYFKKAALNHDWVRLGPGDVEIFDHADANEHNYVAADAWEDAAKTQMNDRLDIEVKLMEAEEKIEELKEELKAAYERIDKACV